MQVAWSVEKQGASMRRGQTVTIAQLRLCVVAAVFQREQRYFIQQRQPGKHMAGLWEFAGGKIESGESAWSALVRELNEELGITATRGEPLIRLTHTYPDRVIDLDVWRVVEWTGEPLAQEQQVTGWFPLDEILSMPLLPADSPVLNAMVLPHKLLVTPRCGTDRDEFLALLKLAVTKYQHTLCILHQPALSEEDYRVLATEVHEVLSKLNCSLVLHGVSDARVEYAQELGVDRIHVPASLAKKASRYKGVKWSVGCHSHDDLDLAVTIGAEFAVLGSVNATASDHGGYVLGWATFRELVSSTNLPVYATGGMQDNDEVRSRLEGAQGIAATDWWS